MPHYKNANDKLFWLEFGESPEQWLPADCVPISDAEAELIREAQKPVPTVQDKLNELDSKNALTQRNLREAILLLVEAVKVSSNNEIDLTAVPGVAKVVQVEAEAAALRAQL